MNCLFCKTNINFENVNEKICLICDIVYYPQTNLIFIEGYEDCNISYNIQMLEKYLVFYHKKEFYFGFLYNGSLKRLGNQNNIHNVDTLIKKLNNHLNLL